MLKDQEILRGLADNEALMTAVKKLLKSHFSIDNLKATDTDAHLGQVVRARLTGLETIETVFKKIEGCRSHVPNQDKKNPAY